MKELLLMIKEIDLRILAMGFITFLLTLILKLPIKKATAKLQENKRKAINSVIILIVIGVSFGVAELYCGLYLKDWLTHSIYKLAISVYLISILIYGTFSRIIVICKGIFSGKIKIKDVYTKEQIKAIKQNVKTITELINSNKKQLKTITEKEGQLTSYLNASTQELLTIGLSSEDLTSVLSDTIENKNSIILEIDKLNAQLVENQQKLTPKKSIAPTLDGDVMGSGRIRIKN
jgi:hypothetical protein